MTKTDYISWIFKHYHPLSLKYHKEFLKEIIEARKTDLEKIEEEFKVWVPPMSFSISSFPAKVKARPLKMKWTKKVEMYLESFQGIDVEEELAKIAEKEVEAELIRKSGFSVKGYII